MTTDPLLDSDEEFADENTRLDYGMQSIPLLRRYCGSLRYLQYCGCALSIDYAGNRPPQNQSLYLKSTSPFRSELPI